MKASCDLLLENIHGGYESLGTMILKNGGNTLTTFPPLLPLVENFLFAVIRPDVQSVFNTM